MSPLLDIHHLRVLAALAEHRSFTRAAEALMLTQSAVSHQVRRIERLVGGRVVRPGRGVHFTPTGERLLTIAGQVLRLLGQARGAESGADGDDAADPSVLRIGCPTSIAAMVLPEALREFRECLPVTMPVLKVGDTPAVREGLRAGRLDVGIMLEPGGKPDAADRAIVTVPMAEDRLSMIVHPRHPWAEAGRVDRRGLDRERFILYDTASLTGRMTLRWLSRFGVEPESCLEVGSMEAIKQLVRLGLGVTLLAEWACAAELAGGSLASLPVDRPRLSRKWVVGRDRHRQGGFADELLTGLVCAAAGLRMGQG